MYIDSVMPSNHIILCHPLLLLLSVFPSIRVFSKESVVRISGQSIGVSASASLLPMNIQDWFPLGLTGWISLLSKGFSRVFSNTTVQKHLLFSTQPFLWSNSHIRTWLLEKTIALTIKTFVNKVMSLLFKILSKFVIGLLPRSKRLLISWLQSPSAVIFGAQDNKICHCYLPWSDGTGCHDLSFLNDELLSQFSDSPLSPLIEAL